MTKAIHYIGSTPTAILGALEPVTALFFGVLIFGEQLTPRIILGIFDGDYCRNSDYRRKNIAEKKQDSVKAYWQIKSDFVSLPLQIINFSTMKKQLMQWAGVGMWMVLGLSACSPTKTEIGNLNVIPQPQEVSQDIQAHPFVINPQTGIVYPEGNEKLQRTAEFLASYIEEATGITVRTTTEAARKNSIILAVDGSITNKEGYQLEVTSENIHLNGGSESGVFYGIQTLYKALPLTKNKQVSAAIPVGTVNDYPRFGYRGFMVDVGRHYFPVSYLKQIIDMLALHNINYFHWHLTEDQGWRIEIKKYPKLTEIGSMRPRTLIDRETQTYDETPHSGFLYTGRSKRNCQVCR